MFSYASRTPKSILTSGVLLTLLVTTKPLLSSLDCWSFYLSWLTPTLSFSMWIVHFLFIYLALYTVVSSILNSAIRFA